MNTVARPVQEQQFDAKQGVAVEGINVPKNLTARFDALMATRTPEEARMEKAKFMVDSGKGPTTKEVSSMNFANMVRQRDNGPGVFIG